MKLNSATALFCDKYVGEFRMGIKSNVIKVVEKLADRFTTVNLQSCIYLCKHGVFSHKLYIVLVQKGIDILQGCRKIFSLSMTSCINEDFIVK
jgi:hypothetical protein